MSAAEILKMIETVSPDDTAKLDEIDARVESFVRNRSYESHTKASVRYSEYDYGSTYRNYTRSRDALKAIRPDEWDFWCNSRGVCEVTFLDISVDIVFVSMAASEELAELHAIIQAIEYERNNK